MNTPNQPSPYHRIRSLEVRGGFLDGLEVDFDAHLNCVIGGRGTGKTTVIEFLRFVLKDGTEQGEGTKRARDAQKLIASNLRSGHVRVGVESREGMRYTVVRSAGEKASVLDEHGNPTNLSLSHGTIFDLDVFSAHQIENIATTPAEQLELIDRFVQDELRQLSHEEKKVETALRANALDLVRVATESGALAEQLNELDHVEDRLRMLQSSLQVGRQVEQVLAEKKLADLESREIEHKLRQLATRIDQLTRLEWLDSNRFAAEVVRGPHEADFRTVTAALERAEAQVEGLLADARRVLQGCVDEVRALRERVDGDHRELDVRYRDVVATHDRERDRAQDQLQLQRRHVELLETKRALDELSRVREAKTAEREVLLDRLSGLREQRTAARSKVAAWLTERLAPLIRVRIVAGAEHDAYERLLGDSLKGTGKQYSSVVSKLVRLPPATLAQAIQARDADHLAERSGLERDKAIWVIEQLADTATAFEIEAVAIDDRPEVELQDGTEYKDASALSTGQRCTAILPILLLESEKPLLIDQPEDNLDNAFIYERIVQRIRDVKANRQLVFVTHNPNIPVLGEAEKVVVMRSDGRRARAESQGSVDELKEDVATILEGGREAFEQRKARYGY